MNSLSDEMQYFVIKFVKNKHFVKNFKKVNKKY